MKVYHTFFGEFKGADEKAVVQALYEDSKTGTGLGYKEWWGYQQKLWNQRYGISIPAMDAPQAEKELLETLVKVGALNEGPKPKKPATAFMVPKNG